MSINLYFGRVVRERRVDFHLSQEELAGRAGLNRTYFGEVERGVVTPSLVTIAKIATALNVTPSTLIAQSERLIFEERKRGDWSYAELSDAGLSFVDLPLEEVSAAD